jgi:hypothetical protein
LIVSHYIIVLFENVECTDWHDEFYYWHVFSIAACPVSPFFVAQAKACHQGAARTNVLGGRTVLRPLDVATDTLLQASYHSVS